MRGTPASVKCRVNVSWAAVPEERRDGEGLMQWRDVRTQQLFPSPRLFGSFHFVEGSERTRTAVHPCHTRSEEDREELLTRFLRGG